MRSLAALSLVLGCATASGETRTDEAPLVIELFTSQGCSSCPPADKLLDKLARDGAAVGRPVLPLAFHVDYWDDLGWADPFALPAWTERQRDYARAIGDDRVYTPQLVVGGRTGVVGSRTARVMSAIADAPKQVAITAKGTWTRTTLTVTASAPADADVFVAVWQDGTRTKVPRGENAGTTLVGDRVVRRLERVAVAGTAGTTTISIDPGWGTVGAVAFAQKRDRTIIGATRLRR